MDNCIFCKIAKREIPAKIVYEDDFAIAFLDISPCAEGHTVVIPKQHFEKFTDMEEKDAGNLFASVQKVAKAVEIAMDAPGSNIGLNNGKAAGQEVPHVHVHIIPRYEGDNGGAIQSIVKTYPKTDNLEELKEKIRESLR
ncbi:MAG: HIT family protein [Candidatus Aenigmarchaeota archaeon]|nr:HIT family protein [Candidatus Aenigmarchaeota archaeon]